MHKTAIVYTPKCLKHNPGPHHPESPKRLKAIINNLKKSPLFKTRRFALVEPNPAQPEDLETVHQKEYIQLVEETCKRGGGPLDSENTFVSKESFEAALHAVGGALTSVDLVMDGRFKNAFAVIRPPGHHASSSQACGFCVFNNATVAASHLLRKHCLNKVLILDIDAHHGNGTQEIFYETNEVLYLSLHQDPRQFPGKGFAEETGERKGLGYNVNIPFPFHVDDLIYLKGFNQIAIPIIEEYKPQFILLSVGFDGHHEDPIAELSLSAYTYVKVFNKILELASKFCNGRLVAVLEGGYSLHAIGKLATAVIARMGGIAYPVVDSRPAASKRVRIKASKVLAEVKTVQSNYWSLK